MKNLIVIRHAKSSWDDPSESDLERPLNKRGKRDAPFMAKLLRKLKIKPDIIIASPARRALSTAKIFSEELDYKKDKIVQDKRIYEADTEDLLKVVAELDDDYKTVMLFGHNPGLTYFVNHITGENINNIPTCGISGIEFKFKNWDNIMTETGDLTLYEVPKKYFE